MEDVGLVQHVDVEGPQEVEVKVEDAAVSAVWRLLLFRP